MERLPLQRLSNAYRVPTMRIGIVGNGVVGNATARCYMESHEVRVYDVVPEKRTHDLMQVLECDIIFVCLPTPQKTNSLECDVSSLHSFFSFNSVDLIRRVLIRERCNFVLRSTVPIGTTRKLREEYRLDNLIHSPEFLTARCAVTDAQIPARNVIGSPWGTSAYGEDSPCYDLLYDLYEKRFPGVTIHTMTSDESEAVKLFQNSFFAVKIAFFNEINQLAQKLGLDWETVRQGMLSDGRIAHSHTTVPGPDGSYGFGGSCLPKDIANLISHYDSNDIKSAAYVMSGAYTRNTLVDRQRKG